MGLDLVGLDSNLVSVEELLATSLLYSDNICCTYKKHPPQPNLEVLQHPGRPWELLHTKLVLKVKLKQQN